MPDSPQCEHEREDGVRCRARPMAGARFCFRHNPEPAVAAQRDAANRRGGRARARAVAVLPADTPDLELNSVSDVVALVGVTINQVRRGQLDCKQANAVGYLSSVLLRALEAGDLAERVAVLEAQAVERERVRSNGRHTR